jgi:hypothetical protein
MTRFFDLLEDLDKPLWDECTNHIKLLVVAQMFTIKSYYKVNETSYDIIVEWTRSILPEENRQEENLHAVKSMMKPL